MKLIRSLAACSAVTLVFGLAPGIAPPASAAGVLVTSPATVLAAAGQLLPLAALFQPVREVSLGFQYVSVVVTLTGGLTAPDGGQTIASQGSVALLSLLSIPVTVKSFGRAKLKVTALVSGVPMADEATTIVEVPRAAPLPGEVRLLTALGAEPAKVGQVVPIDSLFKAVEVENQFNITSTVVELKLTGGLIFASKDTQSITVGGSNYSSTIADALGKRVKVNGSGTVTVKVTAKTSTFDIKDEGTVAVNLPTPIPAPVLPIPAPVLPGPAPVLPGPAPVLPVPAPVAPIPVTVPTTAVVGVPAVGGGNRAPVAQSIQLIAVAGAVTPLALLASDPDANALTFVLVQLPSHGKLSGQAPNLSYTPDSGFLGTDALIFTATDSTASSGQATVAITVTGATVSKAEVAKKTVRKVVRKAVKKPTTKTVKKR